MGKFFSSSKSKKIPISNMHGIRVLRDSFERFLPFRIICDIVYFTIDIQWGNSSHHQNQKKFQLAICMVSESFGTRLKDFFPSESFATLFISQLTFNGKFFSSSKSKKIPISN